MNYKFLSGRFFSQLMTSLVMGSCLGLQNQAEFLLTQQILSPVGECHLSIAPS